MIDRGAANKTFSEHVPCKECGSKDNLALYEDGHGYCFGCKKYFTKYEMENSHQKYAPKQMARASLRRNK
jgi:twinkle protein